MQARRTLFQKYVLILVTFVGGMLLVRGTIELYGSYRDNKAAVVRLHREKATGAALRIEHFIRQIEWQVGWASHPIFLPQAQATEQRRLGFLWLLRQAPSVSEVSYLDGTGREQLRVSRLGVDELLSQKDCSTDPKFLQAMRDRIYFGPVYFLKQSEPYMTLALKWPGQSPGVSVAELNLKLVWDVVSRIDAGRKGYAYVVDSGGTLIAHPDISLVLQKTDLSHLPQVRAALAAQREREGEPFEAGIGMDPHGDTVLAASAPIAFLGWSVLVEQPAAEAFAPLHRSLAGTLAILIVGLCMAVAASFLLARKIARPIQALHAGAARIGAGALDHRIEVRTGDELELLADEFNRMAARLQESYATLEQNVEARTRQLSEALKQLKALWEVSQAVGSTLDLDRVLFTIVTRAVRLSGANGGVVYRYDEEKKEFQPQTSYRMGEEIDPGAPAASDPPGRGGNRAGCGQPRPPPGGRHNGRHGLRRRASPAALDPDGLPLASGAAAAAGGTDRGRAGRLETGAGPSSGGDGEPAPDLCHPFGPGHRERTPLPRSGGEADGA